MVDKMQVESLREYLTELLEDGETLVKGFDLVLRKLPKDEAIKDYSKSHCNMTRIGGSPRIRPQAWVEVNDNIEALIKVYPFEVSEWLRCFDEWLTGVVCSLNQWKDCPGGEIWKYYVTFRQDYPDKELYPNMKGYLFPIFISQVYRVESLLVSRGTYWEYNPPKCKVPYANTQMYAMEEMGSTSPFRNGMSAWKKRQLNRA